MQQQLWPALGVPGPASAVRPACGAVMAALRQQFGQIIISAKSLNVNIQQGITALLFMAPLHGMASNARKSITQALSLCLSGPDKNQ